jgi:hypothetical protein
MDLGIGRQPQREGAASRKKIGDLLRLAHMADDKPRHRRLRLGHRLHERARRRHYGRGAEGQRRLHRLDDDLAVDGEPGDAGLENEIGGGAADRFGRLAAIGGGDIETRRGGSDQEAKRLRGVGDDAGQMAQHTRGLDNDWQQNRAFLDVDKHVGEGAVVAQV